MSKSFEKQYGSIIHELSLLKKIRPKNKFKNHMAYVLVPSLVAHETPRVNPFFFAVKFAIFFIIISVVSGVGVVLASEGSQPGDVLYPVKEAVKDVKIEFTFHPEELVEKSESRGVVEDETVKSAEDEKVNPSVMPGGDSSQNPVEDKPNQTQSQEQTVSPSVIQTQIEPTVTIDVSPQPSPKASPNAIVSGSPSPQPTSTTTTNTTTTTTSTNVNNQQSTNTKSETVQLKVEVKGEAVIDWKIGEKK